MTEEEKKQAAEAAAKKAAEAKAKEETEAKAKEETEAKAKADLESKSKDELLAKLQATENEKADLLKESMGRKDKLTTKDAEIAELKKQFEGIDPEKAREAMKAAAEAAKAAQEQELKQLEDKGQYDKILKQVNEANDKVVADKDAAIKGHEETISSLQDTIKGLTLGNSFSNSTFIKDQLVLPPAKVEALYGSHFDVEDGKVVAYDKPRGSADRTKLVGDKGAVLPFEEAITKIVSSDADYEGMQKSKLKSGASSTEGDGKSKSSDGNALSGVDRIKAGLTSRK